VLDIIPANLIDAPFTSGVRNAQPPPPAPVVTPPQPQPAPPTPQPVVPPPTLAEKLEKIFKTEPPKPAPEKVQPHKIQINTQRVTRTAPKAAPNANDAARARAIRSALRNLKSNLTAATTVDMPGNSSAAYANYADAVKSIYDQAWAQIPLDTIANENEIVKVSVTIASDGTVISARIIESSGDAALDASVQKTLERVTFIAPFPEGTTDKQRIYAIGFNPQLRKMLE
jgi:TonB family protein